MVVFCGFLSACARDAGAETGLSACSGVTPSSTLLSDWEHNLAGCVSCAVAVQPQLAASNVVLNVFIPPWVFGGPSGVGDPCTTESALQNPRFLTFAHEAA